MKSKGRPQTGADPEGRPPPEVIDRLAGLLPEGALEDAVRGLRPEQLSGPSGLLSELAGRVGVGREDLDAELHVRVATDLDPAEPAVSHESLQLE